MSDSNKYTVNDLIDTALDQKPVDFEVVFDNILRDKLNVAINDRKLELAKSMFNVDQEDTEEP